jgi:acyl-CoA thioesterase-1
MKFFFLITLFISLFNVSVSTAAEPIQVLFLGDSLSEGQGLDESQSFPRIVEKKLNDKGFKIKVTNGGVSGSTTSSGLERLKWHLKKKTDVLVLELGANDGLRGIKIAESKKNLKAITKFAKEKGLKVMLLGVLMPPNYGNKYVKEFELMYKDLAREEKIPFMPFVLEKVAGRPEFNLADGIHPNAKGQEIVAQDVAAFMEKYL